MDNKVLRTVYLEPDIDDFLIETAKKTGQNRNELFEKCLILGMKIEERNNILLTINKEIELMKQSITQKV